MRIQNTIFSQLSIIFFISFFSTLLSQKILETPYGVFAITEPVLCELLECSTMKRLQGVNQYGIDAYVNHFPQYTRYQHSVGVMCILRKFGASTQEQIAGLLHDVSHTVFSHVGDHLFNVRNNAKELRDTKDSYQDGIHAWFIKQSEIADILDRYGYTVDDIVHKNGMFLMLEQDAPDLCADRIEYNLFGGLIEHRITQKDIDYILSALRYDNDHWYFVDRKAARMLADVSLFLTEHHFGTSWNGILNLWASELLRRALDITIISLNDIHFSTDDIIWQIITNSDDTIIVRLLEKLCHYREYYTDVSMHDDHDYTIIPKFRGLNPLIVHENDLCRLYDKDTSYAESFNRVKNKLKNGFFVKYR